MKNFTLIKSTFFIMVFLLIPIKNFAQTVINSTTFESGLGIWTPGGSNVAQDGTAPYQGSNACRFRGTTNMTLTTPTSGINILPYNKIDVKFFVRTAANTGESIALQYRSSTLAAWTTIRTYTVDATKDIRVNNTYYAFYATLFSTTSTFSPVGQFQFVAVIGNSSRFIYLDNVSIIGTTFNTISNGPGGVTANLETWLRADKVNGTGVGTDNTNVDRWEDIGKGNDATVIDPSNASLNNRPKFKNNTTDNINFNPVVYFNNNPATSGISDFTGLTNQAELNGTGGFFTNEQYLVIVNDTPSTYDATTPSTDIYCSQNINPWDNDGTGFGYGKYTIRMDNEIVSYCIGSSPTPNPAINLRGYGVAEVSTTKNYSNAISILSARNNAAINGQEIYFNANRIDNTEVGQPQFANVANRRYWLGRSQVWNGSFGGRIAEVISFSSRKNDVTERRRIETYLALKYGITLGVNGTSMNYEDSNGNVVWNSTTNTGYNFDIAGIFRDDASQHSQKQSKSINTTEVMTIGLTDILSTNDTNTNTFPTNRNYLVWGSNGGAMTNTGTPFTINLGPTTVTTFTEIVNRRWKIVETGGDVPTTRVSIPTAAFVSGLPALGPTDAYVMIIADDAAFTSSLETVFMTTSGANQTLLYDFDGTRYFTFGVAHRATNPLHISLDGIDDYVRISDSNELSPNFTVMTWIRPNGNNTLADERVIVSKKADALGGYKLVLQADNRVRMEWTVLGVTYSTVTNTPFPDQKWHNIAVTYTSGSTLSMYIDGVLDKSATILVPPTASTSIFSIGSNYVNKTTINNLFKGDIDELRMWSRVLSPTEIRFLLNQEILQNGTGTKGTIIPTTVTKNDVNSLLWSNLFAYYSMNSYIGTHLDDDSGNLHRGSLIIPNKISINSQTAPMPYISAANGSWASTASWANGGTQDLPYSLSIVNGTTPIDWNIVRTLHNIDSNGNKVVLGLFVNSNTLSASNDSKVEVSHYLKLDGKIDLQGKSQLIQTINSDLDATSAGSLERDQQGTKNIYNYNYWSSPVGAINNTTNNNTFTVASVMKDGTTSTPQNITWTTGLNGSPTSPVTLSSYWIFKFQNLSNSYANWASAGQNGTLNAAQGFTLKGSGSAASNQNYTFVGKPNNGPITTTVAAGNLNLAGNPYASSIDANAFISANSASTTGNLYFWEHSSTNNTHVLVNYQGGYSVRNLTGGTPPTAPAGINGVGASTKVPGRFIPVSQGFFIVGSATGGTVSFNNDQRAFVKEDNASSNTLFRSANMLVVDHFNDNSEDNFSEDVYKRVRLGLTSKDNYHRQILLGFMEQNATSAIDFGYDAPNFDNQPNDMYFMNSGAKLNIQGEGFFNPNNVYPIGIKTNVTGEVKIMVDTTENLDANQKLFILDNTDGVYHEITNQPWIVELPIGLTDNRFSLTFKDNHSLLANDAFNLNNGIIIAYANGTNTLGIKNNVVDTTVEKVSLFNMLGQLVSTFDVKNQSQDNIQLPIKNLSSGTYIVKVKTDKGETTRKIVFN
ncbi:LamG-like jellyroll fold domain-containing protein [Flavobacterium sp. SUN052]|uniref:LamG-like jellyroll fold domain-containing protein n=1 Tax=Flavobacterium sp. SUN052 TaxID=3002441 RepID=UPI00237D8F32|nr:LamG-like jellyroll fold domain-containing protein [Flavobacterium sp. SUN052]MEC4005462.1 LamG-like jellyroll fold domain-containing protein [Flavobacterium sp. SUN052]